MARTVPLFCSDQISVYRFDHPAEHQDSVYENSAEAYTASFVETGAFDLRVGDGSWRLHEGDVMMSYPGMYFRAGAPGQHFNDVCLSVRYIGAVSEDPRAPEAAAERLPRVLRSNNRLRYLRWSLTRAIETADTLLAEYCAAEVFGARAHAASRLFKEHKLSWYAERVHAARERLERDLAGRHTTSDLARSVGMSAFHFTRVFTDLVGHPPHRYLNRARLRAAREMLLAGRSVTDTGLACGFNDLSHFSRSFARRYGMAPSRVAPSRVAR